MKSKIENFQPYAFGYSTADGMSRQERGDHNGLVTGSYSYTDPNGDLRHVKYVADAHGFRAEGDVGVDRKTAEAAAAIAALAPKGPVSQDFDQYSAARSATLEKQWDQSAYQIQKQPFQSYNSFDDYRQEFSSPLSSAWNHGQPVIRSADFNSGSYQIETPTHKVWVKY
ncbi:cuticle protein-like protein 3 [Sarcoptes scabiei]|uniref:Cuticle protein-like protein 3 n=1 Tax=Sarcoptes scabiei TaxID=52283 RepID=A0A132A702_SARSC|nr:cuticle protein-like protein 3 [Sarcoptes scabiei]